MPLNARKAGKFPNLFTILASIEKTMPHSSYVMKEISFFTVPKIEKNCFLAIDVESDILTSDSPVEKVIVI